MSSKKTFWNMLIAAFVTYCIYKFFKSSMKIINDNMEDTEEK